MTVASLTIGNRRFAVVPQREFDRMQAERDRYRQLLAEDDALGKMAERELRTFRKSRGKGHEWGKVRRELGL